MENEKLIINHTLPSCCTCIVEIKSKRQKKNKDVFDYLIKLQFYETEMNTILIASTRWNSFRFLFSLENMKNTKHYSWILSQFYYGIRKMFMIKIVQV